MVTEVKSQSLFAAARSMLVAIGGVRKDAAGTQRSGADAGFSPIALDAYDAARVNPEHQYPTYRFAITGLVPVASATDIFQVIGSATKTVAIRRIRVSGKAGTAVTVPVTLGKRTTANSGGTSTAPAGVPLDSGFAAATAVAAAYTANPTTGTETGIVGAQDLTLNVTTLGGVAAEWDFRNCPVLLRGVAQALAIKFNGTSVTTGTLNVEVEFDERPTTA